MQDLRRGGIYPRWDARHGVGLLRQEQLELADFALHRITHAVNAPLLQRTRYGRQG